MTVEWSALPDLALLSVLARLTVRDLFSLAAASRAWHTRLSPSNDDLWAALLHIYAPVAAPVLLARHSLNVLGMDLHHALLLAISFPKTTATRIHQWGEHYNGADNWWTPRGVTSLPAFAPVSRAPIVQLAMTGFGTFAVYSDGMLLRAGSIGQHDSGRSCAVLPTGVKRVVAGRTVLAYQDAMDCWRILAAGYSSATAAPVLTYAPRDPHRVLVGSGASGVVAFDPNADDPHVVFVNSGYSTRRIALPLDADEVVAVGGNLDQVVVATRKRVLKTKLPSLPAFAEALVVDWMTAFEADPDEKITALTTFWQSMAVTTTRRVVVIHPLTYSSLATTTLPVPPSAIRQVALGNRSFGYLTHDGRVFTWDPRGLDGRLRPDLATAPVVAVEKREYAASRNAALHLAMGGSMAAVVVIDLDASRRGLSSVMNSVSDMWNRFQNF
ncbi:hypothetical protein H9P43_003632 [Blastocladiella emersonii ATCC 22665]|nr:hypothetical protein H9P43_003632 [Blastocladiella emersonii ATCC 22665]